MPSKTPKVREEHLISDFISQAYVLHQSGLVILSRRYSEGCYDNKSDPALVGGLIMAIMSFTTNLSGSERKCTQVLDGKHALTEIGTTCSKWFIIEKHEYVTCLLIPNQSPFLEDSDIIKQIGDKILDVYTLLKEFNIKTVESMEVETPDEFGNTVDNIVSDIIEDMIGYKLEFLGKGDIEQFEYA